MKSPFIFLIVTLSSFGLNLFAASTNSGCEDLFAEWTRFHNKHLSIEVYNELTEDFRFYTTSYLGAKKSQQLNEVLLKSLELTVPKSRNPALENGLSLPKVEEFYKTLLNHQIASRSQLPRYDPKQCGIGFCFGRAMTVHLEGLFNYGLSNQQIRKIWAVGNLGNFRYHVTSVIFTEMGWVAMDPNVGRTLSLREWYNHEKAKDTTGDMLIFATSPSRFGPSIPKYNKEALSDPYYHNYFRDLLAYYRKTIDFIPTYPFTRQN